MQKRNKKQRVFKVVFFTVITLVILIGIFFIFLEPLKTWIRSKYTDKAVDAFKQGKTTVEVPITDMLSVDGENGEQEIDADKFTSDLSTLTADYGTLTLIGVLEIPSIEVEEPVFSVVSNLALRYGCGKFGGTADIGEPGLCSLWGHRTLGGSSHFDRLQELQEHIGEKVYITTPDMVVHEYEIVKCVYAKDGAVMPWMYKDTYEEEMLSIVTCGFGTDPVTGDYHPYNTEFIVLCKPVDTSET